MLWLSGCPSSLAFCPAAGLCHFVRAAVSPCPAHFLSDGIGSSALQVTSDTVALAVPG